MDTPEAIEFLPMGYNQARQVKRIATNWKEVLVQIDERRYLIPRTYKPGMLANAAVYADREMLDTLLKDQSLEQAANMRMLPGIVGRPVARFPRPLQRLVSRLPVIQPPGRLAISRKLPRYFITQSNDSVWVLLG